MKNLRIVSENYADYATLSGTGTGIENLKSETKSAIWRTAGVVASLSAKLAKAYPVDCVALPFTNFTATALATVTLKLGDRVVATKALTYVCGYTPLTLFDWGIAPLGENAYNQEEYSGVNSFVVGGGSYAVVWFDSTVADTVLISFDDSLSKAGSIDASRLVIGNSWSPKYNAEYGAEVSEEDNSKTFRTDSGDLKTDRGARYKKMSFDTAHLTQEDRTAVWSILKRAGASKPVLVSIFPETDLNPTLEQTYQLYGKFSNTSVITASYYSRYSTKMEIEEI